MKKLLIILSLFLLFLNTAMAANMKIATSEYKVTTPDGFVMYATLQYPKDKKKMEYKTVVLLHSLGYDSEWWSNLPDLLLKEGYAVLLVDLRGHGKSVYNTKLIRLSWKNMTNKAFSKYPEDVYSVIDTVKNENKRKFFNEWAIVGVDIGASSAICLTNKVPYKPKTVVLISPVVNAKGIYVPVKLAEINDVDMLSITGKTDIAGQNAEDYLKKFAQGVFASYVSDSRNTGMLMFKSDLTLTSVITSWINQYLK